MNLALSVIALAAALAVTGCGHVEVHEALLRDPLPPPGHPVELYVLDQKIPERPFAEIALVQAIGFGGEARPEDVVQALVERSAQLGCDAVLRTVIDQGYARAHASGVCVRWLAPGPAAPRPVLPPAPPPTPPPIRPAPSPTWEWLPSAGPSGGGGR
jgi:hypothetical protein